MPSISHQWRSIKDLPPNWRNYCRDDLRAVHQQWLEDRNLIKDEAKVRRFQEELALRWAIETGIIERLYTVDRGATVQILKAGMEALGQFHSKGRISRNARALISDQREALEMVMDLVGETRSLTDSFIKSLHNRLTFSQETAEAEDPSGRRANVTLEKGDWKTQPNNPTRPDGSIHEYCLPLFVQDEIDKLLSWHDEHSDVCPEVEAAWLHHRFGQIHPFQDGNGRVARALTGAVFLKQDYLVLVIRDHEHKDRYLDALASADEGDLKPLVDLFSDIQIEDLNAAIKSIRELRGETMVAATKSLAERARRRKDASQERAASVLENLVRIAKVRLAETKTELERAFEEQNVETDIALMSDEGDRQKWWSRQIVESARSGGYYAELARPRRWAGIRLRLPEVDVDGKRLIISLHAVGRAADLHAAAAFLTSPLKDDALEDGRPWHASILAGDQRFRFGVERSSADEVESRFRNWLDAVIENGLSSWGDGM